MYLRHYVLFAKHDPDRLQSEEYRYETARMQMIASKDLPQPMPEGGVLLKDPVENPPTPQSPDESENNSGSSGIRVDCDTPHPSFPRKRESRPCEQTPWVPCMRGFYNESEETGWIPAFAGMTRGGRLRSNDGLVPFDPLFLLSYPHKNRKSHNSESAGAEKERES